MEVTSTPRLETDTYGAGETILFTVTFTAEVVRAGSPVLEFVFDSSEVRQAGYVSGSGTKALVFGYTVVSGDSDANGLFLRDEDDYNNPDGPVRLDTGDTIRFDGTSTDVPLYWSGRGTQAGHKVDGSRESIVAPDAPTSFEAKVGNAQVTLTWDAPASGADITRHEFRYKTGSGSYPTNFMQIASSAPSETNEASFTVDSLTNELVHTFELRAVNTSGESTAVESDPVTPTPGICDRTQQVQDGILAEVSGADACNEVTVADLAGIGGLVLDGESITSLEEGDFAGLTGLTLLDLQDNQVGALPANLFSGLTSLQRLDLFHAGVTSLPADAFSGLTALTKINLSNNSSIGSLPADQFSGLTNLVILDLTLMGMTTLPAGLFSELSGLTTLRLNLNELGSLPAGVFSGLSQLSTLDLASTGLSALPNGVFSGLTALTTLMLGDNPTTGDTLPLTVTVEKVGDDGVRAKVLAGAPFTVDFTPAVVNGSLPTGVTTLEVAAGSVDGTLVTVTRTEGTTDAVTVDVDLSTQPTLPGDHSGYEFARSSDLPKEIVEEVATIDPPTGFSAEPGADQEAVLAWTPPPPASGYTSHEYRYKVGDGSFTAWTAIPDSGPGGANGRGYTVTGLGGLVEHTFELRARDADDATSRALTARVTPTGEAVVTLHLSDNEPHEDLLAVTVTATVAPATPVAFTVEISASPVAPATDDDFELSTNRTLSFAANATGSTGTVRISPVSDDDPEPNDVVTVSGVVSNPAIPNPDDVTLTILNDDADLPQDIAIDAPAAVDEGAGTANVTVTLTTLQNTAPVLDAQLFYRERPGTATRGADYNQAAESGQSYRHRAGLGILGQRRRHGLGGAALLRDRHRRRRGSRAGRDHRVRNLRHQRQPRDRANHRHPRRRRHPPRSACRPEGVPQEPDADPACLDRPGGPRQLCDHGLQGRGLRGRGLELERRRAHPRRRHRLSPWRTLGRRHAALPGVGDQRRGRVGPLERRVRLHPFGGPRRDEPQPSPAHRRDGSPQAAPPDPPGLVDTVDTRRPDRRVPVPEARGRHGRLDQLEHRRLQRRVPLAPCGRSGRGDDLRVPGALGGQERPLQRDRLGPCDGDRSANNLDRQGHPLRGGRRTAALHAVARGVPHPRPALRHPADQRDRRHALARRASISGTGTRRYRWCWKPSTTATRTSRTAESRSR